MSIDLNGSSQYLYRAAAVVSAYPWSWSIWFKTDDVANPTSLVMIQDDSDATRYWRMRLTGGGGIDPVTGMEVNGSTIRQSSTSTGINNDTTNWHNAIFVAASSSSRIVYLDGGGAGESTANETPTGIDITVLGVFDPNGTPLQYWNGLIAECAMWNAALSGDSIAALQLYYPNEVQTGDLVAAWHFDTNADLNDLIGVNNLTAVGTPTTGASHPTLSSPGGPSGGAVMYYYAQQR